MSKAGYLKIILPIVVLLIGMAGAGLMMKSRRPPEKAQREFAGVLVETVAVKREQHQVTVAATGTVQARRRAMLAPQVSGRVTAIADEFIAGGFFREGETLFELEKVDYRLAVEQAEADLAKADLDLALERGRARVAKDEWQRLQAGNGAPNPLVVYEPQLKNAEARVGAARATLAQARINLERTMVKAPFNCLLLDEDIDLGQYVRAGNTVATVIGTDLVEIVVPLPLAELSWLDIPRDGKGGAAATVQFAAGDQTFSWPGRLVRALGEVDPRGRMARVVIDVDDPYLLQQQSADERPPLAVGMFVDVLLQGQRMEQVAVVPRRALRDGDTVWLADRDGRLRIRAVEVLRREKDSVLIGDGLQDGERLIVSAVAGAADGLKVRLHVEEAAP